jgi:hypothetical protein
MYRSSEAHQRDEHLRKVVKGIIKGAVYEAYPDPAYAGELKPYKETRQPVGIVAAEEHEGCVYQRREKGPYDYEVAVRDLALKDASAVGERKPVIHGREASPGEQQMRNRGHNQQKSDRD